MSAVEQRDPGPVSPVGPSGPVGPVWAPDRRAERIRAAGEAEQARAAAEATRAQTAQRWELLREQRAAERAERGAAARAARSGARRDRLGAGARSVVGGLPAAAGVVACVAPTLIATRGQYAFARDQMQLGAMSVLVPAMLEGAAWLLAWRRHQAVTGGEPAGRLTAGVWVLAGIAAALNLWHGTSSVNLQVGAAYALASLVGFALVELLAGHRRGTRTAVRRPGRGLLVGVARLARYPRLSWAAWSRRVEIGPGADPAAAWEQAWRDRFDVGPGADARARRRGRDRVRDDRKDRAHTTPKVPAVPKPAAVLVPQFRSAVLPEFGSPVFPGSGPTGVPDSGGASDLDESDGEASGGESSGEVDVSDLLEPGRAVAAELAQCGERLTRVVLVAGLRGRGVAVSTDRATALLALLRREPAAPVGGGARTDREDELRAS